MQKFKKLKQKRPKKPLTQQQFKALQNKWYDKLAKSGFDDIEVRHSPNEFLRNWDSHHFMKRAKAGIYQQKLDYFQAAQSALHDFTFDNKEEFQVWEAHCDGLSIRDTAKKLKRNKDHIFKIMKKLKREVLGNGRSN